MKERPTYSLREILQYAYQLKASMGPVDISTLPQAMVLANEENIKKVGGEVNLPDWRREQLEEALKQRFPESYYYAVERGAPSLLKGVIGKERS